MALQLSNRPFAATRQRVNEKEDQREWDWPVKAVTATMPVVSQVGHARITDLEEAQRITRWQNIFAMPWMIRKNGGQHFTGGFQQVCRTIFLKYCLHFVKMRKIKMNWIDSYLFAIFCFHVWSTSGSVYPPHVAPLPIPCLSRCLQLANHCAQGWVRVPDTVVEQDGLELCTPLCTKCKPSSRWG